ncbi:hypothetical protein LZ24_00861 [Desulfobotulus alkaliphilus]|uniref:Phenyltransferase domain-containing protein n=1 Tax=Desulfobotulus alkaliphilus TaxID=622671 RepID=A0A562S252_9BACT|nr:phenyltransferase domain-containing protein [Desulfobotulus alkaliphilus]TWI75409.1 hypothetical protein LZ24_00861 [Desulfobotulus alkaliphilus]
MEVKTAKQSLPLSLDTEKVGASILATQRESGEIPWCGGDKTDPWDMVESIMGLSIAGHHAAARRGFAWLKEQQLENGAWYASYKDGLPDDRTQDTNMTAYIATGLFHDWLLTKDREFLEAYWPVLEKAMAFILDMQAPDGEIWWARSPEGKLDPMCLLTGSSSIFMSLKCACAIAFILGKPSETWQNALTKLGHAIRHRRHVFNVSKSRYSMDWFYPVLCGALTGQEAQRRMDKYWKKFIVEGMGVRCVSDNPWVTMAETSELVLALAAMGNTGQARIVFNWILDRRYEDGSFWCGFTFPDMVIWPEDRLTWTNAVVLMAADALYGITPAAGLFDHAFWADNPYGVVTDAF